MSLMVRFLGRFFQNTCPNASGFVFALVWFGFSICQKPLQVLCDMKYTEGSEVIRCSIVSCNCSKYLGAKITSKAEVFSSGDGRRTKVF